MPILRVWFNVEADLRQDFRLSRRAMHAVQRLLQTDQDHGWGQALEVLIYVYWLAHGLSYIVVARVFNVPKSTVHRLVNKVAKYICKNLRRAVALPQAAELAAVDEDVAQDLLDPQPPREPLTVNESSGNATRDRLAAQV
ncbi:hypothetical protein PAMA_018831 [Pampus argenteus]